MAEAVDPDWMRLDLDGQIIDVARHPDGGMAITIYTWVGNKVVEVPAADWARLKAFVDEGTKS